MVDASANKRDFQWGGKIKDATASPGDVSSGKVFYNNNGRQVGTLACFPILSHMSLSIDADEPLNMNDWEIITAQYSDVAGCNSYNNNGNSTSGWNFEPGTNLVLSGIYKSDVECYVYKSLAVNIPLGNCYIKFKIGGTSYEVFFPSRINVNVPDIDDATDYMYYIYDNNGDCLVGGGGTASTFLDGIFIYIKIQNRRVAKIGLGSRNLLIGGKYGHDITINIYNLEK